MIPFMYGTVVTKDFFCGREEVIVRMNELLLSSQNIVLHGERRIGKSSLVIEVIRRQILAKLRSKIQHISDISFVYAGSIRSQMEQIFADIDSPFFRLWLLKNYT